MAIRAIRTIHAIQVTVAICLWKPVWSLCTGLGKTSQSIVGDDNAWMVENAMSIGSTVPKTARRRLSVSVSSSFFFLSLLGALKCHLLTLTRRSRWAGHGVISVTTLALAPSKSIAGLNFSIPIVAGISPCSIAKTAFMICDMALAASLCPRFGLI